MSIDGSKARFLRCILNVPTTDVSRISRKEVRRRCSSTFRFSTFIFRPQLCWLGRILRKPTTGPLRLLTFQPHTDLEPRRPPTYDRVTTAVRGRRNLDWGQDHLRKIRRLSGKTRRKVMALAQDRQRYHQFIERLYSLADQS